MSETNSYYIVKRKALPEVLLKVVEAKALLDSEQAITIQEATDRVGISRSSFYKYKDDIFRFHDNTQGKTITLTFSMDDKPGLLADLLKIIAKYGATGAAVDTASSAPHAFFMRDASSSAAFVIYPLSSQ